MSILTRKPYKSIYTKVRVYLYVLLVIQVCLSCKAIELGKSCYSTKPLANYASFEWPGNTEQLNAQEIVRGKLYIRRNGRTPYRADLDRSVLLDSMSVKNFGVDTNKYILVKFEFESEVYYTLVGPQVIWTGTRGWGYTREHTSLYLGMNYKNVDITRHEVWYRLFVRPMAFNIKVADPFNERGHFKKRYVRKFVRFFKKFRREADKRHLDGRRYEEYFKIILFPQFEKTGTYKVVNNSGAYGKINLRLENGKLYNIIYNRAFPSCYKLEPIDD